MSDDNRDPPEITDVIALPNLQQELHKFSPWS